jgi:TRAP-type mannitol/chloroaromatic compound transport system substrate-binding protein
VGPYDDEKLGLHKVAKYYYYPGWWEPGPTLDLQINLGEWQKLPPEYQAAIEAATFEANLMMQARYDARNNEALARLIKAGVILRPYSAEILAAAEKAAFALYEDFATKDKDFENIFRDWQKFRDRVYAWHNINESSFDSYSKLKR